MDKLDKVVRAKGRSFLIRVETSADSRDYEKYERLRNDIWDFPEDNLPGSRNLMCENFLHDGGALILSVYDRGKEGELGPDAGPFIAFSYGFVGVKDKEVAFKKAGNLRFYSQYTGIRDEFRGFGLGVAIKEFQREKVRDLFGISTVTCTYDPLTGVNAWRNVHHFGMDVEEYRVSTYGEYGGRLNRLDVPSDRFFMSWDLTRPAERSVSPWASAFHERLNIVRCHDETVAGRTGPARLEVVTSVDFERDEEILYARIPRDFYLMLRETDVDRQDIRDIPIRWRLETRRLFQTLFAKGYAVADFFSVPGPSPGNFYVLRRTDAER
jgi:predicted GNAT superfamily acetyltransferase